MKSAKSFYSAFFAAGLLAVPATGMAAGFQNTGQSATATAMGYAGVGNPNEPNASFYNPASMSFHEGFKVYLGDTIIWPSSNYEPAGGGAEVRTESQVFPPPNAHISYDNIADSGVSAGVGMTFSYGLGIAWPEDWVGRTTIVSQDLQTVNINPNVAYKIPGVDLSVAAGAQFIFGSVDLKKSIEIRDDEFVEAHLGGEGFGVGGVAALMYKPLEELTLGAQYRSRVNLEFDDGKVHFEGEEDTPFFSVFRDNPASTEITLPDLISVGAGYQLGKLFLIGQVDYTLWSTYDRTVLDIETGGDENALSELVIENNWNNAFAFRVGAQYDVTERLAVRLGAVYDMTPIPDETVNASLPDNDRIDGCLGLGYSFGSFRVDAAYSLVHSLSREIDNDRTPPGSYGTDAHLVAVNVGYGY